jgi:hypothetical protein
MMYGEFENWLNMYSKSIMVGESNKILHLVLARWTSKNDDSGVRMQWKQGGRGGRI